jgi:hypothetical protein
MLFILSLFFLFNSIDYKSTFKNTAFTFEINRHGARTPYDNRVIAMEGF